MLYYMIMPHMLHRFISSFSKIFSSYQHETLFIFFRPVIYQLPNITELPHSTVCHLSDVHQTTVGTWSAAGIKTELHSLTSDMFSQFLYHTTSRVIQGDSVARDPKLLSIKNYVIEIMTWKFIYTYRERCKTGPAHNRCWNWSPFTSKHTWMCFSKCWNTFPKFVWGL